MRILVFFDLPVLTKIERKYASNFRKFLIKQGYHMLQLSVYSRICKGIDEVYKHMSRLHTGLPPKGSVRVLEVTDTQYGRMQLLLGSPKKEEQLGSQQLLLF
jgi:CRISPR-associated protein Cas2